MNEALQLAGQANPTINLAREAVLEALALQNSAEAMVLPNLTSGANLRYHAGNLQRSGGGILDVDSHSLYAGAGAGATGGSTVANPGIRLVLPLGDAFLEPQAARQRTAAQTAESMAIENRTLMGVIGAYFELLQMENRVVILRSGEETLAEITRIAAAYAEARQGRAADANRALTNLELLRSQLQEAEGERIALSASLSGLLDLDPSLRLHPSEVTSGPIRLVDENAPLEELERIAVAVRPEIAARSNEIAEARTRLRQEEVRPWLPTLSAGFSAGAFGGGNRPAYSFSPFDGRTDFDVLAVWSLQNFGAGNLALKRRSASQLSQATNELTATIDAIHREVAEARASAKSAHRRREIIETQLAIAEDGFQQEMTRIREGVGKPLEVLDSFRQLLETRLDQSRTVADYNLAQFRLFAALGSSPASTGRSGP